MKISLLLILLLLAICGCKKGGTVSQPLHPGSEIVGSWVGNGTYYAGSKISGSTTFVFNNDKTFVAIEKAKGMPTLTEAGEWLINGDTLKLKYKKIKKTRIDEIAYHERNGGALDIIKPVTADSSGIIAWNYKIFGNKLMLGNNNFAYSGINELTRE